MVLFPNSNSLLLKESLTVASKLATTPRNIFAPLFRQIVKEKRINPEENDRAIMSFQWKKKQENPSFRKLYRAYFATVNKRKCIILRKLTTFRRILKISCKVKDGVWKSLSKVSIFSEANYFRVIPFTCRAFKLILKKPCWIFKSSTTSNCPSW